MTSKRQRSKSSPSSKKRAHKNGSKEKALQAQEVALAKVKDDFSKYLRLAVGKEIVITRHGRPAGVLIGFETEDDWLDYRLENDPDFLRKISESRLALQRGLGVRIEDLDSDTANFLSRNRAAGSEFGDRNSGPAEAVKPGGRS